jgi:N-acetylmuramoyl-L-alanine amidase
VRNTSAAYTLGVILLAAAVFGQAPNQDGPITVLSREGRRALATSELQGRQMVALEDLAGLFQLQIREDPAARAVTVSYRNQTIVLTPDQSLVSASGRLVSMPSPLIRQGRRWMVPVEFISRALAPVHDVRIDLRPASRLLILGDLRVPRVRAEYDESPAALRVTLEITPRATTTVVQEQGRLIVRIDADALDAALPSPPSQVLLSAIRAIEPNSIQMDLGPRFASFQAAPPVSRGASAVVVIELVATESSAAPAFAPDGAAAGAPPAPLVPDARPSVRTIVIDPGHGGGDNGVKGPGGRLEKDITMSVARRAKGIIEGRLGVRVLLTHDGSAGVDADRRAALANNNKADLFISLHANGSPRQATKGASIFVMSLDRFGEDTRRHVEADRIVLPLFGGGARELALVEWELAQAAHVEESTVFASFVEQKLRSTAGLGTIAMQRAPIRGLAGTNMPAVLFEMGYLSNPEEERLLASADFQNAVAQALTDAVVAFREYRERQAVAETAP